MPVLRWIKYEEDLSEENGHWNKPHISQLSFQQVVNLRYSQHTHSFSPSYTQLCTKSLLLTVVPAGPCRICLASCTLLLDPAATRFGPLLKELLGTVQDGRAAGRLGRELAAWAAGSSRKTQQQEQNERLAWLAGRSDQEKQEAATPALEKLNSLFNCMEAKSETAAILVSQTEGVARTAVRVTGLLL